MDQPRMRIAIVGGGIAGLTLAASLSRLNKQKLIDVDIYEAALELTEIGAGITIWPRTWEIIQNLGLEDSFAKYLPLQKEEPSEPFYFRKSDQTEGIHFFTLNNGLALSFHRADVQQALLSQLSPTYHCHLSHRLISYTENDENVFLKFQDGSESTCDLLIGADGINSAVRKTFFTDKTHEDRGCVNPVWSGTVVYRGLIPTELVVREIPQHRLLKTPMVVYCGKDKHIVCYPISKSGFINLVGFYSEPDKEGTALTGPAVVESTTEELLSKYVGWEQEVQALLRLVQNPSKWAIQTVNPLKFYASGRVALMGDAAHAMTLHLGSGAGQAMEDAYILSEILSRAIGSAGISVARITEVYNNIRHPVGNFVLSSSRNQGLLYEFNGPGFEDVKEGDTSVPFDRLSQLGQNIEKGWEWVMQSSAEEDRQRVQSLL